MSRALLKHTYKISALFLLLLFGIIFFSCDSGEQNTDGDQDTVIDGDTEKEIGEYLQQCYDFCDKSFECDQSGFFTQDQQQDCYLVCEDIESTCVSDTLIECGQKSRCDEFNSCVIQAENGSSCTFPIDGDSDSEINGYTAKLETSPSLNFGAVIKGESVTKELEIYNTGVNVLEIYNILITGNLEEFDLDYNDDEIIYVYPEDHKSLDIIYSPIDGGTDEANLFIYSNSQPNRITQVSLESDYKGIANIAVDKTEVDFGDVSVGKSSDVKNLRITNNPQSSTDNILLTITDIAIANQSGAFDFSSSANKPPFTIVPGGHVDIGLVFSPQSWGESSDILTITSDSYLEEDQNLEITLKGNGVARRLCMYPESIAFGSVKVDTEAKRTLELEACGSADVTITEILFTGAEQFILDNVPQIEEGGLLIEAGDSVTLDILFNPTSIIAKTASVKIKSNDLFFPVNEVLVSGQGVISNLVLSPPYLSFGDVALGGSKTMALNLSNSGSWPLEVSGADFDLGENSTFAIENAENIFPFTLEAFGGDKNIDIIFTPDEANSLFDNLTILSDNSSGNITAGLSGRGTSSEVMLTPDGTLEFNNVQLATSRDVVLTVTNSGTAALTLQNYSITEGNAVFSVSEVVETVLQQNVSKNITVTFTPDETGEKTGSLLLETDATSEAQRQITVDLLGFATDPVLAVSETFPYSFGQVLVGNKVGPTKITLTNTGSGTLLVYNVKEQTGFNDAFELVVPATDFPVSLRPESEYNDSFSFYVYFAPESEITYNGEIILETDDNDSLEYSLIFTGKGGKCPEGFYDYDDNPLDCEYECHFDQSSPELCNNIDDNCDGETDEGFSIGNLCSGVGVCPDGYIECDPQDSAKTICNTNPGGSNYTEFNEICNNLDDDCDGLTDEDYFVGQSCDGAGECGIGTIECKGATSTRCSTERGGSEDQAVDEICDEKDNDCDGLTDEDYSTGGECSGVGVCGNGVWECSGVDDVVCSTLPGGSEYEQNSSEEVCDRLDNDCDGFTDEDWNTGQPCLGVGQCGLGFVECNGLNDSRCSTNPGGSEYPSSAPEDICDGLDNDCDGFTDEDYLFDVVETACTSDNDCDPAYSCNTVSGDCISNNLVSCDGVGECGVGVYECRSIRLVRCSTDPGGSEYPEISPQEVCDGKDNDCDGFVDEDFGIGVACDGIGGCGTGVFECDGKYSIKCSTDIGGSDYDDPEIGGSDEVCDNIDNNCDSVTDEGFNLGVACDGVGECGAGYVQCNPNDSSSTICSTDPEGNEPENEVEVCDGLDNDCDGITDEVCKVNIYRYIKEHTAGTDYEYRLAALTNAPADFTLDSAEPVFSLYESHRDSTVALVELSKVADTDTTYSADADEITSLTGLGWTEGVILGYASTSITAKQFYRVNKTSVTAHNFTANHQEYLQFQADGFTSDMPADAVYVYPAIVE